MGFLDQVREGREAAKSKREYAECYKARQERLRSFRSNAIVEFLFKYPDANLLLNSLDRKFLVSLKSRGGLLLGEFADDYYPRLDYVGDKENTSARSEAVARFRREVRGCEGNLSQKAMELIGASSEKAMSLQTKGFAIYGSTRLELLVGGALFLNGKNIATSTLWDPKPKGFLNARLYDEVLQGGDRGAGIQSLLFVTGDFDSGDNSQKMTYEILFDRSLQYFNEDNHKEFTGAICNLRDFILDVEDYFRRDRPETFDGCKLFLIQDAKDRAKLWFESPDRDEDLYSDAWAPFKFYNW